MNWGPSWPMRPSRGLKSEFSDNEHDLAQAFWFGVLGRHGHDWSFLGLVDGSVLKDRTFRNRHAIALNRRTFARAFGTATVEMEATVDSGVGHVQYLPIPVDCRLADG